LVIDWLNIFKFSMFLGMELAFAQDLFSSCVEFVTVMWVS